MADPQEVLAARVRTALAAAFGAEYADADPVIRPSTFADYQANVALPLAKRLGRAPRDVAEGIVRHLDVADVCSNVEVSGPGFINLTLRNEWIARQAAGLLDDPRLGVPVSDPRQEVVVDYSAPNVSKEMHVGHLRTTVVGDAVVRILEYQGHEVIRANHLGDWGTQFGMMIEHLLDVGEDTALKQLSAGEVNAFYQAARVKFDGDPAFAERSRRRVVLLQGGDAETLRLWQELVDDSKHYYNTIYQRLGITLTDDDLAPESFYNSMLASVCDELERDGIAVISNGALCVFPPGFTGRDGEPLPMILRKSDGGYGYDTTDLAAIRYRIRDLKANRLIYVVGADQSLHFRMLFAVSPPGRLADRRGQRRARGHRPGQRPGWPTAADPHGRAGQADHADRRGGRARRAGDRRPVRRPGPAPGDRRGGRHRRAEIRRPVGGQGLWLRIRLRPDARAHREHRPLPSVRDRPDPLDLPQGWA